jgi:hypothetical protein
MKSDLLDRIDVANAGPVILSAMPKEKPGGV